MTSKNMNMEGHLEDQPPAKKPRIDGLNKGQQPGSDEQNGCTVEQKEATETSTTTSMDLPRPHRKLPAEMNQQIYLCFNPATQRKFIWGLGWDFYAMFRYRLLKKTMKVCNPRGIRWNETNTLSTKKGRPPGTKAIVSANGLNVSSMVGVPNVFVQQAFPIFGPQCRVNDFPGTICYYYEVKGPLSYLGLSNGANLNSWIRYSYSIPTVRNDECRLAGVSHPFVLPEGAMRPTRKRNSDNNVFGCGLVLDPEDKLTIFFTLNGQLMGRKIPISPTVGSLFPAFKLMEKSDIESNFGEDQQGKPFEYDIKNCPGLELAGI